MFDFHGTLQRKVQRRILLTLAFLKKNPLKDHFLFTNVWEQDIGHNDLFTVKMRVSFYVCIC